MGFPEIFLSIISSGGRKNLFNSVKECFGGRKCRIPSLKSFSDVTHVKRLTPRTVMCVPVDADEGKHPGEV